MNKTTLTLIRNSCVLSLLVLMSHIAVAESSHYVHTTNNSLKHKIADTVVYSTNSSVIQTTKTVDIQVNPRVFSLDANSDTVGDIAIAKFGCDCSSCRALALQMLQTGKLTL
ncbi:MAG: hypothetical protein ACYTXE_20465 [Nostoc sp.]